KFEGALAAVGFDHLESAFSQPLGHQAAERSLVVDEEQMGGATHFGGANILTQASLRIGGNQPIQGFEVVLGPCGPLCKLLRAVTIRGPLSKYGPPDPLYHEGLRGCWS